MTDPTSAPDESTESKISLNHGLMQLLVWVVTIVLAYSALSTRISVLETKYDAMKESLTTINSKLDRLLEQRGAR